MGTHDEMIQRRLKGHVGEWLPRQPQWQHWGLLQLTGLVYASESEVDASRVDTGDDEEYDACAMGNWEVEETQGDDDEENIGMMLLR